MVPVLARSDERSVADPTEKAQVSQVTSALLTWTLVILVPLTLMVGVAAGPISALLTPVNPSAHCARGSCRDHRQYAACVRAASPPILPDRRAVRRPSGIPQVCGLRAGSPGLQPGAYRFLSRIRPAGPRAPTVQAVLVSTTGAVGGRHAGRRRHGAGRLGANLAAATPAPARVPVPARRSAPGGRPGGGRPGRSGLPAGFCHRGSRAGQRTWRHWRAGHVQLRVTGIQLAECRAGISVPIAPAPTALPGAGRLRRLVRCLDGPAFS